MSGTDCFQVSSVMLEQNSFFLFKVFIVKSERGTRKIKNVLINMEQERNCLNEKTENSAQMSTGRRCAPIFNSF